MLENPFSNTGQPRERFAHLHGMQTVYQTPRFGGLFTLWILVLSQSVFAQQGILFETNPYPDHYFLAPSGLRADAGERYVQNTALVFFHTNKTKSRGRSLGWGLVPTFVIGETSNIPIWITAAKRWRTRNPKLNPWVGAILLSFPESANGDGWIFHGGLTVGTKDKQLSTGAFVGSFNKYEPPFKGLMLNGQLRFDRTMWLVCENYLLLQPAPLTPLCLWGVRKKWNAFALELGAGWTRISQNNPESVDKKSRYIAAPWFSAVFGLRKKPEIPARLLQGGVP